MRTFMNILMTGFRGTSSELLVKKAKYNSLILPNDKVLDSKILLEEISVKKQSLRGYNYILSFGQKPNITNKIFIETTARNSDNCIKTNFQYDKLKNAFEKEDIQVKISDNAGTSFCNSLYWNGLSYIINECLDTKMIFIHIPFYKNISESKQFFCRALSAVERIR